MSSPSCQPPFGVGGCFEFVDEVARLLDGQIFGAVSLEAGPQGVDKVQPAVAGDGVDRLHLRLRGRSAGMAIAVVAVPVAAIRGGRFGEGMTVVGVRFVSVAAQFFRGESRTAPEELANPFLESEPGRR